MVEPPELREPHRRRPPRPSRERLLARRAVALLLLGGSLALLVWLGTVAVGAIRGEKSPEPPPPPQPLRIVFPEGFTRAQMAKRITAVDEIARERRGVTPRLSAREYLASTARSRLPGKFADDEKERSLEGFLFPATYEFTRRTTSRQLVADQLAAFRRNWKQVDLRYARSKNLTPYDVLIIASMIEREVRAPEERALVSAVIYNRLHARMHLSIDASLRYGLHIPPGRPITKAELASPNPYNTTTHYSVPPTPISNPGLASIRAAAHPAPVNYLFFVRKPDRVHHFFTVSLKKFNAYIRKHPVEG